MNLNFKKIGWIILAIIGIELISYAGYLYPFIRPWSFLAVAAGFLALALLNFRTAFFVLFIELFISSKGYLFYLDWGGIHLPVRMALFLLILGVWTANLILKKTGASFFKSKWLWPYLALAVVIIWGIIRGLISGSGFGDIFFDANAYFFFALAPVVYDVLQKEESRRELLDFLFAASIWVSIKTLILLFIISHIGGDFAYGVYRWVRTTGVGEITDWGGGFFRVFIQSQIYTVFALIILLAEKLNINKWFKYSAALLFFATIFVSFSRSFEVGLVAALGILLVFKLRNGFKSSLSWLLNIIILAIGGYLLVGLISGAFFGASASRAFNLSDSAANTRMAELHPLTSQIKKNPVLGSGFGTMLTFKSSDPRITMTNPAGMYTTSAFEWGYLDILMKVGILGFGIYLYLIWKIGAGLWKERFLNYNFGLLLGLIALLVIHMFSPYLNHPLGIGYLMILTGII